MGPWRQHQGKATKWVACSLGLETYKTQLRMLGRHRKADSVQKYINKHAS